MYCKSCGKKIADCDYTVTQQEGFLEMAGLESAQEVLIEGFEMTEDSRMMERYLEISIEYAKDGNGEFYKKLAEFAELLAKATGKDEQLEAAKEIYFWIVRLQ